MTDVLTTSLADERRANGDSYTRNIYERPYTAEDMDYIDYLDIGRVISIGISGEVGLRLHPARRRTARRQSGLLRSRARSEY